MNIMILILIGKWVVNLIWILRVKWIGEVYFSGVFVYYRKWEDVVNEIEFYYLFVIY